MPGLVCCGRRWDIGSDDFVFPGIAEAIVRAFWLVVIVIVFNTHDNFDCRSGQLVRIYYIGTLVFLSGQILVNSIIVYISMQGSITSSGSRRHLGLVLYVKALLSAPEIMWLILGTFWAFDDATDCRATMVITVKVVTVIGWCLLFLLCIGILIVFDPLGRRPRATAAHNREHGGPLSDDSINMSDNFTPAAKRLWENRCKVVCCCAGCDEQSKNAFSDIAKMFSDFFKDLDLVPTDIAAGLILLESEQKKQPRKLLLHTLPRQPSSAPSYLQNGTGASGHTPGASQGDALETAGTSSVTQQPRSDLENSLLASFADEAAGTRQKTLVDVEGTRQETLVDIDGATASTDAAQAQHYSTSPPPHGGATSSNPPGCDPAQTEVKQPIPDPAPDQGCDENEADNDKPFPRPADWMTVPNCAYYMRYALACYSWPIYMFMHPCVGCCKLTNQSRCFECTEVGDAIVDDNCCRCHLTAIRRFTGIDEDDLVYASFHNKIYELPFYVVVDHNMCSVVVAIRGTLSLRDALTDLTAECESVDCVNGMDGCQQAHRGILHAAKYIYKELEKKRLLEKAFSRGQDYQLVITGHSLGAGAAALLSLLIHEQYPQLNCYSYSPPGGLLSKSLSRLTEDFVCSVVLGDDVVPRLGIVTMETLKCNMLRCVRDSNKPKYRILAGGCWSALCGHNTSDGGTTRRRDGAVTLPLEGDGAEGGDVRTHLLGTGARRRNYTDMGSLEARNALSEAITTSSRNRISHTRLYPPGHILFIHETSPPRRWFGTGTYDATWARADVFDEIIVSSRMISHHLPDTVLHALEQLDERDYMLQHVMTKY